MNFDLYQIAVSMSHLPPNIIQKTPQGKKNSWQLSLHGHSHHSSYHVVAKIGSCHRIGAQETMKAMQHQILEAVVELLHVLQKTQKLDQILKEFFNLWIRRRMGFSYQASGA